MFLDGIDLVAFFHLLILYSFFVLTLIATFSAFHYESQLKQIKKSCEQLKME